MKSPKWAKESACGPDGGPFSAYRALPELSGDILYNASTDLQSENPATDLSEMNKQLVWLAPEGASDEDLIAIIRTPNNLRTIFGSNCDSKFISSFVAQALFEPTLNATPESQRGFCRGRQLSSNIVDLSIFIRL